MFYSKKIAKFSVSELRSFLKTNLPDYMIPAITEVLEFFPVLSSGKVNRKALPKPTQAKAETTYVAPKSELAKEIAHVWEKVLDYPNISADADFFMILVDILYWQRKRYLAYVGFLRYEIYLF